METFITEQLSPSVWKIVENDPYKQYPFLYVIIGIDKCILIDTGSGSADYLRYLESNINSSKLPYLVICTHVHFVCSTSIEKITLKGSRGWKFSVSGRYLTLHSNLPREGKNCTGIWMGGRNKTFTQNFEINSLAMAHSGAKVKDFSVTRWLNEGEFIYLDDKNQTKENSLEVLFTPGHTPDSISLYAHFDRRLFVGDIMYPFTAIHLDSIGSSVDDFKNSLKKMISFIDGIHKSSGLEPNVPVPVVNTPSLTSAQKRAMDDFCATLGMSKTSLNFSLESLMELSDWSASEAVNFYLSSMDSIQSMCPIQSSPQKQQAPLLNQTGGSQEIKISCGHVESNLNPQSVQQLLDMIEFIQIGALSPAYVDGEYGEFSTDFFTLMVPMKTIRK